MNTLQKPLIALCAVTSLVSVSAAHALTYGTATIDGAYSEWSLATDFYANMYEAGKGDKTLFSKLYLRYDCSKKVMNALVLKEGNNWPQKSASDAWIKIYSQGSSPRVDGSSGNNGTAPDFSWVAPNGLEGSTLIGYEASFAINPGTYTQDMEAHIEIKTGKTSSTGKGGNGGTLPYISLNISCPVNTDTDGDGISDNQDNCPSVANANQMNTDGDGQGDACDSDDDNDTIADGSDNCPLMSNANQMNTDGDSQGDACDTDDDNDTVADGSDNCPLMSNANQMNTDGDSQGDACDNDDDNDTVADGSDNCPLMPNQDQANADEDTQGDACDNDDDNDTVVDGDDNCPLMSNQDQADADEDGIGDACDTNTDTDGDGIPDATDNCPLTSNADQMDTDQDGKGDVCDKPLAVDLVSFNAAATSEGTRVTWETANEEDILGFDLYKAALINGRECTQNIEDYASDSIERLTDEVINGGQNAYEFVDEFTADTDTIYCYALFNIENDGSYVWLGVTARQ